MLITFLYFLPCIVSLLWLVSFIFKVKTPRQTLFMWIQAIDVFYYATYATYIAPSTDYLAMVIMDAINIPLCLTNFTLYVLYLRMHIKNEPLKLEHTLMFAPALIVGAMSWIIYYMIGFNEAADLIALYDQGGHSPVFDSQLWKLYGFVCNTLCNALGLAFAIIILCTCVKISRDGGYHFGDVFRFFFRGNTSTSSRAISLLVILMVFALMPLAVMGRDYLFEHYILGIGMTIILAIIKNFIAHVEFYSDISSEVTLYSLSHIQWTPAVTMVKENPNNTTSSTQPTTEKPVVKQKIEPRTEQEIVPKTVQEIVPRAEQEIVPKTVQEIVPRAEQEQPTAEVKGKTSEPQRINVTPSAKTEQQAEQLRHLLEDERIYKDENLTIATLSDRMGLGRSSLSLLINTHYGMPFRDLVNKYRIEAAKQYMLANRTATQEVIAMECGFKTASYLNSKFKEMEGVTPMMWLAQQ